MARKNDDDIEGLPSSSSREDLRRGTLQERPDLGLGLERDHGIDRISPPQEPLPQPAPEPSHRREENPFSFKRFLNQDCGARRKEYSPDGAPVILNTPEKSSMLPDFVQDHLVVEQCYLSSPAHHASIPFDLPLPAEDRLDPAVALSLPDFLSDGPIEAAAYLVNNDPEPSNGHLSSPGPSSRNELDWLQREVDSLRRQLQERSRRVELLESEVALLHSRDARETDSLEYALQQVENNLRQTSKRMMAAENAVIKLKADNKILKAQLDMASDDGRSAGAAGPSTSFASNSRNQRLAQDLRGAASAAEVHLRSLMSGIENLRMLASTVEDRPNYDYDDADEGASGPAL